MRSLWTITYRGAHTATTIKKLERLLSFRAADIERERFVREGANLERAVFFVDHGTLDWNAMVMDLLHKTSFVANRWESQGNSKEELSTTITADSVSSGFREGMPAGLRELTWTVRLDQVFRPALISTGSSVMRW